MYKDPETRERVALSRHCKPTCPLGVGARVIPEGFPKGGDISAKTYRGRWSDRRKYRRKRTSTREVLEARKGKMSPGAADSSGHLKQQVEAGE